MIVCMRVTLCILGCACARVCANECLHLCGYVCVRMYEGLYASFCGCVVLLVSMCEGSVYVLQVN